MTQALQLLVMILYCLTLWFISTYRFFSINNINYQAIILAMVTQIVDVVAQQIPKEEEIDDDEEG